MPLFDITYYYKIGTTSEQKEAENQSAIIEYLIKKEPLLLDPVFGDLRNIKIAYGNAILCHLFPDQLELLKDSILSTTYEQIEPDGKATRIIQIRLTIGGDPYTLQAIRLLWVLSTMYLKEFNVKDDELVIPFIYENAKEAKRHLQYLCEFCKIAEFQLSGTEPDTW